MTDTPDALIDALYQSVKFNGGAELIFNAKSALRTRLTAGDDAIKRLADVEQKKQTLLDGMKLQDAVLIDAGMVLDEYEWRNARAEKSEADLAAARAEVERLQSSINVALDRYEADDKHGCWKTLMQNCGAALAPKETNNG